MSLGRRSAGILNRSQYIAATLLAMLPMAPSGPSTAPENSEASDVATLWVAVRARLVISARRHSLRAVDRLRAAVKGGEMLATPLALLDHLLHDQAEELERIAREATERVDDIEDALLAGRAERHSAELARLRRLTVRLAPAGA